MGVFAHASTVMRSNAASSNSEAATTTTLPQTPEPAAVAADALDASLASNASLETTNAQESLEEAGKTQVEASVTETLQNTEDNAEKKMMRYDPPQGHDAGVETVVQSQKSSSLLRNDLRPDRPEKSSSLLTQDSVPEKRDTTGILRKDTPPPSTDAKSSKKKRKIMREDAPMASIAMASNGTWNLESGAAAIRQWLRRDPPPISTTLPPNSALKRKYMKRDPPPRAIVALVSDGSMEITQDPLPSEDQQMQLRQDPPPGESSSEAVGKAAVGMMRREEEPEAGKEDKLALLEAQKQAAIVKEDFLEAHRIKEEIEAYKASSKAAVGMMRWDEEAEEVPKVRREGQMQDTMQPEMETTLESPETIVVEVSNEPIQMRSVRRESA